MNNEELKQHIISMVPEAAFEEGKQFLAVTVPAEKTYPLALELRHNEATWFDYLFCLSGIDWVNHFTVVYHLSSTVKNHSLVLKSKISDRQNPSVDSVSNIWRTAEFHEREVYDLFGIKFNNNPDLRRILLDEDWNGYPLRKDYVDDVNIVELE